jgi:hypothetical protein
MQLFQYFTEMMSVPFYAANDGESIATIVDKWEMQPSFYLGPMTRVISVKKPLSGSYIFAEVGDGAHAKKQGMIWSGHLRQARKMGQSDFSTGVKLTGASYGVTKNTLETVYDMNPLTSLSKSFTGGTAQGMMCNKCKSPLRNHKIYESEAARDLAVQVASMPRGNGGGGQYMIGILMAYSDGCLKCVIGAESSWKGTQFKKAFTDVMNKHSYSDFACWANEELNLMNLQGGSKGIPVGAKLRDFNGNSIEMRETGDTMQCAGPKLIQAYLQLRNKERATDQIFMSEIFGGGDGDAEKWRGKLVTSQALARTNKRMIADYGPWQSASACMRCRVEIPPMLCGKAPGLTRASLPQLLGVSNSNSKMEQL